MPLFDPKEHHNPRGPKKVYDYPLLKPGSYTVVVQSVYFEGGREKPYYSVRFELTSGQTENGYIKEYLSTTEKAWWRLAEFCMAIGLVETFDPVKDYEMFRDKAMNRVISVDTHNEENSRGEVVTRVERFNPTDQHVDERFENAGALPENDDIPF